MSHFEKVWFIGMLFHCCKLVSQDNFFGAGYFLSLLKSMQFWAQITMKLRIPSSNTVTKSCWKRNNMNAILRVSQLAMDSWIYSVNGRHTLVDLRLVIFDLHSSNTKFILGFLICSTFQQVGGCNFNNPYSIYEWIFNTWFYLLKLKKKLEVKTILSKRQEFHIY